MISVIIPVYNVEKYLAECIDSVLCQSYTDYEIILVDDGATDSSGEMCDEYALKDSRIRVIHQPNGGLSAARNTGLRAARGEYVYFLDSDDYIEPCALEDLLGLAERETAGVVFFDSRVFFDECDKDGSTSKYIRQAAYPPGNGREMLLRLLNNEEYRTAVPLMFFRTNYLLDNELWFKEGIIHEDELFTFLVFNADGRIAHCHEQLYARRVRPASIMTSSGALRGYDSMLQTYFELSALYRTGKASGEVAKMYLIRAAKNVLGKYNLLSEADRENVAGQLRKFKKDVMSHRGFGDIKLKIKCSGRLANLFYRAENKLLRMIEK
ncbi:MAG: glycosyltransferase family 2 protein [Oscillospiraceae bacterium]|nr:glycosyltransferase family 2 protein [Oscillospiraceae bacterium]